MPKLFIKVTLSRHAGFPPPAILAAVDLDKSKDASAEEYFTLQQKDLEWTGTKEFQQPASSKDLLLMVAFFASIGAKLSTEVREDSDKGKVLAQTSFIVTKSPDVTFLMTEE